MRFPIAIAAALLLGATAARAADLPTRAYPAAPAAAVRPVPVVALAPPPLRLECSPYTDEPITVIYNEPGRAPWSVRPDLKLVPLGHAKRFDTRGAYPSGY